MAEEEVDLKTLNEKDLLLRIAQELTTQRKLLSLYVNSQVEAESEIPEKIRRFLMHFHDMKDLQNMYHELGITPPDYIQWEVERCADRARQLLKELNTDGGVFEKVRREMAADPENKYDHTRLLPKKEIK